MTPPEDNPHLTSCDSHSPHLGTLKVVYKFPIRLCVKGIYEWISHLDLSPVPKIPPCVCANIPKSNFWSKSFQTRNTQSVLCPLINSMNPADWRVWWCFSEVCRVNGECGQDLHTHLLWRKSFPRLCSTPDLGLFSSYTWCWQNHGSLWYSTWHHPQGFANGRSVPAGGVVRQGRRWHSCKKKCVKTTSLATPLPSWSWNFLVQPPPGKVMLRDQSQRALQARVWMFLLMKCPQPKNFTKPVVTSQLSCGSDSPSY